MSGTELSFCPEDLRHWRLLDHFRKALLPHLPAASPAAPHRQLSQEQYFSLFLFRMFNPVITSMRGLCAATHFSKMRRVCAQPVAPSSFSEAQHLYSPEVLAGVVKDLAKQAATVAPFGQPEVRRAVTALTAVDGSLWRAVNRMAWAPRDSKRAAVRLDLHFSVFDQVPVDWSIGPAQSCEVKQWKKKTVPGTLYVADRLYSQDLLYLKALQTRGIDFVVRLRENFIRVPCGPEAELSAEDDRAGVVSDQVQEVGAGGGGPQLRIIQIDSAGQTFLLATTRRDLPAHVVGLIYRYRWQIELFFKWVKTMLPCRHWLAESPEGANLQLYCVLIAALLLMLAGRGRPTKRQMEALWFYWSGFASEEELLARLAAQKTK